MSYARFSAESDVYVFAHYQGFVQCCGCILGDEWDFHTLDALLAHLQEHVAAGHTVPADLLDAGTYDAYDFEGEP
ncbi:hypothetical protein ACXYTP_23510 [Tsukamurella ocularis]